MPLVDDVLAPGNDWGFTQFWPSSCTACDLFGDGNEYLKWMPQNDVSVMEALYSTDGDQVIRFFLGVATQAAYRAWPLSTLTGS